MNSRTALIVCLIVLVAVLIPGGCVSKDPEEEVRAKVTGFLDAINADEPRVAFEMYSGKDFLAPASITMLFKNKGIQAGGIKETKIISTNISDNLALVETNCVIIAMDLSKREIGSSTVPIYFKLQNSEVGWIITRVSFTQFEMGKAAELNLEIERTIIDDIADNSVWIFVMSVLMLSSGLYLNKKDKKTKGPKRKVDTNNATVIPKETLSQYIRLIPAQQMVAGNKTSIDVWVKNFAQHPYDNFAITAKFANTVAIENTELFFDRIGPGDTAKKTWQIKPMVSGWASVEEPTIVFEYMGNKYTGVLDQLWLQVQ